MKVTNTASRLKSVIQERRIRQVDILNAARPYCEKYGIKLEKNDLSQYVNGKVEPGQEKLTILGLALNVSEAWLMGYDVSPSRTDELKSASAQQSDRALIDPEHIPLYGIYKNLPKEDQDLVNSLIHKLSERQQRKKIKKKGGKMDFDR